jgi:hypothetical protein
MARFRLYLGNWRAAAVAPGAAATGYWLWRMRRRLASDD